MRRTTAIRLTLLSAASLAMAGCGDDSATSQDTVFVTEAACIRAYGADGEAACQESFRAAAAEHAATAPRFADMAACEADTGGRCETTTPRPGLAAYVVPAMAGVLIGRALADNSRPVMPVYRGSPGCPPGAPPTPECQQQRTGSSGSGSGSGTSWYYAGRQIGGSGAGAGDTRRVTTTPAGAATMAQVGGTTNAVSRGGLGAAGRGFASAAS